MRVYSLLLALTCSRFALAAQARAACARGASGAIALARAPYEARDGGVAERLKAHAWKVCMRETVSRVRIPPPPPRINYLTLHAIVTLDESNYRLFPEACAGSAFARPHRDDFPAILDRFQSVSLEVDFRQYGCL